MHDPTIHVLLLSSNDAVRARLAAAVTAEGRNAVEVGTIADLTQRGSEPGPAVLFVDLTDPAIRTELDRAVALADERRWVVALVPPSAGEADVPTGVDEVVPMPGSAVELGWRVRAAAHAAVLKERARRLAGHGDAVPAYLFYVDRDRVYREANRAFGLFFAVPREQILGRTIESLIGELNYDAFKKKIDAALAGETVEFPVVTQSPATGDLHTEVRLVPDLAADGSVVGFFGVATDVTARDVAVDARRRVEQRFVETQRLESLGVLAGGIAHDFNNLLTGILGNAGLAAREVNVGSPLATLIDEIELASRRAADLTHQLLVYAGRARSAMAPVSLHEAVGEISGLLRASVHEHAVLRFELAETAPWVEADAAQLRQVVVNLVGNASEALGDEPGSITVSTGVAELDASDLESCVLREDVRPGRFAFLEVVDTGRGMDDAARRKAFDPFFTTKLAGRGLGLACVLGIVRAHGGTIRLDTRRGEGTRIRVLLPWIAPPVEANARPAFDPFDEWWGSGTVLVADDEPAVRGVVESALRRSGFDVVAADDGAGALDLFGKHRNHLALAVIDLTMPKQDGAAVLRAFRAELPELPVVLMSGYDVDGVRGGIVPTPNTAFLQKPFGPREFVAAVRSASQR
jgi:PAS domain S-box-containing protein